MNSATSVEIPPVPCISQARRGQAAGVDTSTRNHIQVPVRKMFGSHRIARVRNMKLTMGEYHIIERLLFARLIASQMPNPTPTAAYHTIDPSAPRPSRGWLSFWNPTSFVCTYTREILRSPDVPWLDSSKAWVPSKKSSASIRGAVHPRASSLACFHVGAFNPRTPWHRSPPTCRESERAARYQRRACQDRRSWRSGQAPG